STEATAHGRRMSPSAALRAGTRETTRVLASAISSTDAIASEADDQVDPHKSANCTIDLVSSSMKPAPRKKKCHDHRAVPAFPVINDVPSAPKTAIADTTRTTASAAR